MSASPVEVSQLPEKEKLFTFGTLVTRLDEYKEMVESAKQAGFDRDDVEFLYIDNSVSNKLDGFSGANKLINSALGRYLIMCHQDVLFEHDGCAQLVEKLDQLNELDSNWALAGNAGKQKDSRLALRITDPHGRDVTVGKLPANVVSLDENFLVINLAANVGCTRSLSGFHLYGTDLCYNAVQRGYSCYVIDFHLTHKSVGVVSPAYHEAQEQLMVNYSQRKAAVVIQSMCSRFYVSSSAIKNTLFNHKPILNLHSSFAKKKSNT